MKNIINERLSISESFPLIARFYDYKHFTYPWHFHSEYEIIYIKEGSGTRFVGDSIDQYAAGDILLVGTNLPHYMKSDDVYFSQTGNLRVKGAIIQFEKEFMYHSINHYPHFAKIKSLLEESRKGIYFTVGSSPKLGNLLNSIPQATGASQIILFLQLLKEMSETPYRQTISTLETTDITPYDTSRIDKIISYLNQNYTRHISLNEIASFAAMNPTAFCRFFKSKTGKSFNHYLLDMRIEYACKLLLLKGDENILQISAACGFYTVSHFNKIFKKNTGYTPSQYKKMM